MGPQRWPLAHASLSGRLEAVPWAQAECRCQSHEAPGVWPQSSLVAFHKASHGPGSVWAPGHQAIFEVKSTKIRSL